ncbi:MAG: hypothetical protein VW270_15435, partial [Candidatus Poseidoniales archaeon]
RGDFIRYTLYSLDANLVQRFLIESRVSLFDVVQWNAGILSSTPKENSVDIRLRGIELAVVFDTTDGFRTG